MGTSQPGRPRPVVEYWGRGDPRSFPPPPLPPGQTVAGGCVPAWPTSCGAQGTAGGSAYLDAVDDEGVAAEHPLQCPGLGVEGACAGVPAAGEHCGHTRHWAFRPRALHASRMPEGRGRGEPSHLTLSASQGCHKVRVGNIGSPLKGGATFIILSCYIPVRVTAGGLVGPSAVCCLAFLGLPVGLSCPSRCFLLPFQIQLGLGSHSGGLVEAEYCRQL